MKYGFLTEDEMKDLGLKHLGKNVKISRDAQIWTPGTVEIGDNSRVDAFTILNGNIKIGKYCHIAPFCTFIGKYGITLRDYVGISTRVTILTSNEDYLNGSGLTTAVIPPGFRTTIDGPVVIMDHVLIGINSTVLPNCILHQGAVIGAYVLVRSDISAWTIWAGSPARQIRTRPKETILKLQKKLENEDNS